LFSFINLYVGDDGIQWILYREKPIGKLDPVGYVHQSRLTLVSLARRKGLLSGGELKDFKSMIEDRLPEVHPDTVQSGEDATRAVRQSG
jgi:hypothetical protein